jgi:hypothetical protein
MDRKVKRRIDAQTEANHQKTQTLRMLDRR